MKAEGVEGVREPEDGAQGAGEGKWEMINTNEWKIHNKLITLGTDFQN